jgi:TfoX/Sxy family transcriptional regulator of competence genes
MAAQKKPTKYDEGLAERIREQLQDRRDVTEKKMFGGICFLVKGKMCCAITQEAFMVRVGTEAYAEALSKPYARVMDFTGRPSRFAVYVDPAGYRTDAQLKAWLERGLALALSKAKRS